MPSQNPVKISDLAPPKDIFSELVDDVRRGFAAQPKSLPPKYFYDAVGSDLFVEITRTEEYYPTRVETGLLELHAKDLVQASAPTEILEIGSGASRKTQVLLEALEETGGGRYVAFDISRDAIEEAADRLTERFDWLEVEGFVGDFHTVLGRIPNTGRRLLTFLGSTLGNLTPEERTVLFRDVRRILRPEDAFLLGIDLIKPIDVIERAYNDAAGVTAAFNRNLLHVLNRELDGDLDPERFDHVATFDARRSAVVSRLRATAAMRGSFQRIELPYRFEAGEELFTEISIKFERSSLTEELRKADLRPVQWIEDQSCPYALVLIR